MIDNDHELVITDERNDTSTLTPSFGSDEAVAPVPLLSYESLLKYLEQGEQEARPEWTQVSRFRKN